MSTREMTTSEVSRNLSAVLDQAEQGETIAVTRSGRRVALIVPAPRANGAAVTAVFREWAGKLRIDDDFEDAVSAERAAPGRDGDPWRD